MSYLYRVLIVCVTMLGAPMAGLAEEFTAIQGGVVRAHILPPSRVKHAQVHAFGRTWPVDRQANGTLLAWIGIDMATKPGTYALRWQSDTDTWLQQDHIIVTRAHFRTSHIRVAKKMAEFDAQALARIRADQADFRQAYRTQVQAQPPIAFLDMPVHGVISTPFGARRFVNGAPRAPHAGIDIAAPEGTPITVPLAGRVLFAKAMFLNGNAVAIGHGRGLVSVYTHLQALEVQPGQWVDTGEYIGKVGKTGRTTGPHLHWGVRFHGARINPLVLIPGNKQEHKP